MKVSTLMLVCSLSILTGILLNSIVIVVVTAITFLAGLYTITRKVQNDARKR